MNEMSETNKVVLAAVLGIIIGFGFGRFSMNRQTPTTMTGEGATSTLPGEVVLPVTAPTDLSADTPAAEVSATVVDATPAATTPSMTTPNQQTSNTSAVSALDQKAGLSVMAVVSLDRQGWVAVHEQTAGKPGKVLGAKHFGPATGAVTVPLKRATVAGGTYYVMLHSDDGDINDLNLGKDLPLLGANGMPIMAMFRAL